MKRVKIKRKRNEKIGMRMRKIKMEIRTGSFCSRKESSKISRVNFRRNRNFDLEKMLKKLRE